MILSKKFIPRGLVNYYSRLIGGSSDADLYLSRESNKYFNAGNRLASREGRDTTPATFLNLIFYSILWL